MRDFTKYELDILNTIAFADTISYSKMNIEHLSTDLFTYHLKKLIVDGFIQKLDSGKYTLTDLGKNTVSRLDGLTLQMEEQCKTVVVALCQKIINKKTYYLLQKRSRQPMKDYYCLPGGKARSGELLRNAILRELKEETGLTGSPILSGIRHTIKFSKKNNQILSDDIIYCYKIKDIKGDLIFESYEGTHHWLTMKEITRIDKLIKNTIDLIKSGKSKMIRFTEENHLY